ncbi:cyclic nucleotide-binding protein [Angomonas deanei]|uniref:Cyclic nucleotide-binding domain containing protein n=1 Tax=Angomonas deanei TaxID=59799 RepID=A0A7G2CU11_9TRYP|nr:cyclic nucleotide-binding protein [Angomonas deanei]CAD2221943.1 hypothetical protein, conserved [Angomonas deanei]|eukprot:EPY26061.1 cyclic nucleotide-binding protein [Angomonas deanei]
MADDEDQKEQRFQASPNAAEARRRSRSRSKNIMELSLSLDNGEVEEPEGMPIVCTSLVPGQTFGVEGCVFGSNSKFSFRAGSVTRKTIVALVPIEVVYKALSRSARFAQAVGGFITSSFDVFGPVRKFCRYVFSPSTAQNEYLPLWMILDAYTKIHNVIHTKLYSKELDTGAWGYALNRLPSNLTTTFCFDLVHALPPFVATRMRIEARGADIHKSAAGSHKERNNITFITTKERRRCTWHLGMKGKTLVLLRDGFTDLLDFLTMLCVHIIESNKLRGRIQGMVHPPAIDVLDDYLRLRDKEEDQQIVVSPEVEHDRIKKILQGMPLSEDEQRGLFNNWKSDTLLRIYEIMMHREEYNVRVDPSVSRKFQTNPFHEWALNLRRHVMEKLGLDPSASLPDDVTIDIISSNTHCMKNLLGGFLRRYRDEVLEYVKKNEQRRLGRPEEWNNVDDMLYVALPAFVQNARPDLREELSESVDANGITVIQDTAMTGLQVDVIPVYRIDLDTIDETIRVSLKDQFENAQKGCNWNQISKSVNIPEAISKEMNNEGKEEMIQIKRKSKTAHHTDSSCSRQYRRKSHFILNMDFAFGAQAEGIARALFSAFGKRIRSVSVMGKAGGLKGKRGDIQLATHVLLSKSSLILEDNQDELRNCRNQDFTQERLQELAGPRVNIHHGKVLTVTGTMLQNVSLLRYYKYVWNCVGTEMEGSYFARVIEDFYRQGIAHPGLTTRFAYYTSDLPLAQSEAEEEMRRTHKVAGEALTLSAPMTPLEGTPPLYAIARGILEKVLMHSLV